MEQKNHLLQQFEAEYVNSCQEKKKSVNVPFLCLFVLLFQVILYSAANLSKAVFSLGNYWFTFALRLLGSSDCLKVDVHK